MPNEDATTSNDAPGITHPLWSSLPTQMNTHARTPVTLPIDTRTMWYRDEMNKPMNKQTNKPQHAQEAMEKMSRETESHTPTTAATDAQREQQLGSRAQGAQDVVGCSGGEVLVWVFIVEGSYHTPAPAGVWYLVLFQWWGLYGLMPSFSYGGLAGAGGLAGGVSQMI
ncbi:hypothetical protein BS47DRAFT_1368901 [Hydnum rufescens UP504]|uniref:Uncharacterized protein n=1 Tax=Hydnum rufescens UP504 TaxID=1448309 RepID=A0A9P6AFK8_9AGAM|nr:hypothetical protein BS47DRAFT_1368901 [Hydnum rufescens UP504]